MSETHPTPEQPDHTGGASHAGGTSGGPARGGIDLASMNKLDLGIIAAGLVALLASFLPYYTMSFDMGPLGGDSSDSTSAWEGFFGWFGVLCAVAAAAILAAQLFGRVSMPFPTRLVVLALFAVALLCTVLALFVWPGESCEDFAFMTKDLCKSFDEGRGVGYWLALLSTAAGTALAAMRRSAA